MTHRTPHVEQETLTLRDPDAEHRIAVGSPDWFEWLETATAFTFACSHGAFTARREHASSGRGTWYWRAYQHRSGARRRAYLGKASELSLDRLHTVAAQLANRKEHGHAQPIALTVSAELPSDLAQQQMDGPRPSSDVRAPQLLATKLYLPQPRPDLVARPRLFARLDAGLQGALTLVCAPAGFGKTTLLAEWLQRTGRPAAWLGLDAGDDDPTVFLRYLVAALQMLAPDVGATTLALLQSPPPLETLLIALLNDLARLPQHSILALDDYHVLEAPPIHQALAFLLGNLPPTLHLIIVTREDPPLPLARLRARRQVVELRAEQLRFTADEAAVFLTEVMGLPLTAADVAALEARTEGWIAGLQFAALAMHDRDDYASFIAAFTGSNRFVVDYLADEVLSRQPAHIQTFLLRTFILDRMCGPLCDAILGVGAESTHTNPQLPTPISPDSYSQLLLEQLERANLFVTPLDAERHWYRYHHLFAEVLHERLRRGANNTEIATLHLRASAWYEQAGLTSQAVQHALAVQAFGRVAALVEPVASAMIQHTELTKLLTWLDALPTEELHSRPLLGLCYGMGLFLTGRMQQATTHLEAIEVVLATDATKRTPEVQAHAAALRAYLVRETGELTGAITLSRQALNQLPAHDSLLRAMVSMNLAMAYYLRGDFGQALLLLTAIIASGQTTQRMANTLSALYLKTVILRAQGALAAAHQLCQDGLEMVARYSWHQFPSVGFLYVAFGDVLRERNELHRAAEYLEKGVALGQEGGHPHILIIGHVWMAWLRHTQADVTGSHAAIRAALQVIQHHQVSLFWPLPSAACYQARLWIAQGNLTEASHWSQIHRLNQASTSDAYLYEVEHMTQARLLIAQRNLVDAEALLHRLHQVATERNGSLIEILILQAITCAAQQRDEAALSALAQALELAEREGFVRLFVDEGAPMARLLQASQTRGIAPEYVEKLLAAFTSAEGRGLRTELTESFSSVLSPQSSALVEPLTPRELVVLQLLADGASNNDIAQRLIISLGTAKKHLANIFGKLNVQSRTQAVAQARALKLL